MRGCRQHAQRPPFPPTPLTARSDSISNEKRRKILIGSNHIGKLLSSFRSSVSRQAFWGQKSNANPYLQPLFATPTIRPTIREGCSAAGLSSFQPETTTIPSSSSSTVNPRDPQKKASSIIFSRVHPIACSSPKENNGEDVGAETHVTLVAHLTFCWGSSVQQFYTVTTS